MLTVASVAVLGALVPGLSQSDVAGAVVTDRYTDRDTGVTHVYLRQRYRGLDVIDGTLTLTLARDGSVAGVGDRFVRGLASKAPGRTPLRSATAARSAAIRALEAEAPVQSKPELVYAKDGAALRLAWNVRVIEADGEHAWDAVVDARDGTLLAARDWVAHSALYNVWAPPLTDPEDGARSVVFEPADPLASPFGWLDTDGVAGPESTRTIGNNVHAGTDNDNDSVVDAGSESDGLADLLFDFPFDPGQSPLANRAAAVTNLFFVVNYMHDVAYRFGFTEQAGNFQTNNYGRGGLGADAVSAQATDTGLNTENASFLTPPDGDPVKPRMSVWRYRESQRPSTAQVEVVSPADIAGMKTAATAAFGTASPPGGLTAPVALVDDGAPPLGDACSPPAAGSLTGKIALVDRGGCTFHSKGPRVEAAGAVGMIVVQNTGGPPILMPGDGQTGPVGIPAAMISQADGNAIKAKAPGSVQATLTVTIPPPPSLPDRASALDNTIVMHEYTHGISVRLTGGPSNASCLPYDSNEPAGLGEGWADFLPNVLTRKPEHTATTPRAHAAYVSFDARGNRPSPLSTDMSVDPATHDMIKQSPDPHFAGWVWSSMLWDLYWKLGADDAALQLVFDGMKIQPCTPGFVDARDAIITADELRNDGDNRCAIWQAFARRGLGANATQGDPMSLADGTESFVVPDAACAAPSPQDPVSPGDPDPPAKPPADTTGPRMSLSRRALALDRRGRATVQLACPSGEPGACAGRVTITRAAARKARRIRLGSARFTIAAGERRRVAVRLSRTGRRLVRRHGRLRVRVVVTARDQAGNRATTGRTVWLTAR
jgi:extracellular elastinolytic metalloproteinase